MRKRLGTIGSKVPLGNVRSDSSTPPKVKCWRMRWLDGMVTPAIGEYDVVNGIQWWDLILKGKFFEKCECSEDPPEPDCVCKVKSYVYPKPNMCVLFLYDESRGTITVDRKFCYNFGAEDLKFECAKAVDGEGFRTHNCDCDAPAEIIEMRLLKYLSVGGPSPTEQQVETAITTAFGVGDSGSNRLLSKTDKKKLEEIKNSKKCDCTKFVKDSTVA